MTLIVAPLREAPSAIARWSPSHVLGLGSPGTEALPPPATARWLSLTFHDIAEPRPGLTAASEGDVRDLLAFAQAWDGAAPLLVQCWAGVSRSPAAAYAIACARTPPGREVALAKRLRAAAPFATPNPRIIALADALLARNGAMIAAIQRIGRGAEVSWGTTFRLGLDDADAA